MLWPVGRIQMHYMHTKQTSCAYYNPWLFAYNGIGESLFDFCMADCIIHVYSPIEKVYTASYREERFIVHIYNCTHKLSNAHDVISPLQQHGSSCVCARRFSSNHLDDRKGRARALVSGPRCLIQFPLQWIRVCCACAARPWHSAQGPLSAARAAKEEEKERTHPYKWARELFSFLLCWRAAKAHPQKWRDDEYFLDVSSVCHSLIMLRAVPHGLGLYTRTVQS